MHGFTALITKFEKVLVIHREQEQLDIFTIQQNNNNLFHLPTAYNSLRPSFFVPHDQNIYL